MALNSLFCADVPLSNYSLTLPDVCWLKALSVRNKLLITVEKNSPKVRQNIERHEIHCIHEIHRLNIEIHI